MAGAPLFGVAENDLVETGVESDELGMKRALWRAHHRGTKEADMLVGGFADRWLAELDADGFRWFEALLEEQDVDILAWAFGKAEPPEALRGVNMDRLISLDYIRLVPR
ncbi:MAG: succinate dehydrogenase assembly factor 2 [Sandaracinobacteroides sp.]